MTYKSFSIFLVPLLLALIGIIMPTSSQAAHGVSIDGKLKYPADFTGFAYTSAQAKPGGHLILHSLGSFDKFNPYTLKGTAPDGMGELVFETLGVASLDEPFARYGLIAQDMELAPDGLSMLVTLRPEARFSDNSPITSADVKFSLAILKGNKAHPFYSSYFHDISQVEIITPHKFRFHFRQANREIHIIACELPILSQAFFTKHPFSEKGLTVPIGSGPYVVADFKPGKAITYRKNPNYWGRHLAAQRGMYNFATITYKFFKDQFVSVEAFKAGDFDFMTVNIAKQWARDMTGPKFTSGQIIKEYLHHNQNAGMQGFVINTRRPLFKDVRVRQALGLAFDFSWTNRSLFFDQYTQSYSYFSNSPYAARGLPSPAELKLLSPWQDKLPPEVFTTPLTPVKTGTPSAVRRNLRQAQDLLAQAGWHYHDGALRDQQGKPFKFEIMLASPAFERVMAPYVHNLQKLGINATYRTIDLALYVRNMRTFDFDMMVNVFGQSQSPGNEQRQMWGSAAADQPGSRNYAGIKSAVIDDLVNHIIKAANQADLITSCHALDRVLWYGYYVVPNWFAANWRVVYWHKLHKPAITPLYYTPFQALMTWWVEEK